MKRLPKEVDFKKDFRKGIWSAGFAWQIRKRKA